MRNQRKYLPVFVLLCVVALCLIFVPKLRIYENLNSSIPGNAYFDELEPFLEKGKKAAIFSVDIQSFNEDTYRIDSLAEAFSAQLQDAFPNRLDTLQFKSDVDPELFADFINKNLFLFLDDADYDTILSRIAPKNMAATLAANKVKLSSAQSIGTASMMAADPLHFSTLAYRKLGKTIDVGELIKNEGLFISRDRSKILITSRLLFDPSDVVELQNLSADLSSFAESWQAENPALPMDFFGSFLITEANASQIKSDIILTVNLAILFIVGLLFFYYRSISTIVFFLLPGMFGLGLALCVVYFLQGGISALALSAGAVILGIVVDYSFHYFSHLSQDDNPYETRNKIFVPLVVSSVTTVIAFFSLTFANSEALQDFGLFTGLSLIFTLVFIVSLLPGILQLFKRNKAQKPSAKMDRLVERLANDKYRTPGWLMLLCVLITVVLGFFAPGVQFEDDLNNINFYPEALKKREIIHQNINPDLQKRITVVASGKTADEAVAYNHRFFEVMNTPKIRQQIDELNSIGGFVFSNEESQRKAEKWNNFWRENGLEFDVNFNRIAQSQGYNLAGFSAFWRNLEKEKEAVNSLAFATQFASFRQLVIRGAGTNLLNSVVVPRENYPAVKAEIEAIPGVFIVDGAGVATAMVDAIRADFNLLLLIASITVFVTMLLVYGRIELTLISFLPMAISWIWILGLASIFDIKFNFINIIIATIIFGLGDDFAIFITDGLQQRYKFKTKVLATHQAGILLSSVSTIIGTGVLFFGQHPAIRSIAAVSVIGISTILLISFVVQPYLYRLLILNRTEKGKPPYTLVEILLSIYAFSLFPLGCIFISVSTGLIILTPFVPKKKKKWAVHKLIQIFTGILINTMFLVKKRYYNYELLDFKKPSIIIANHSSFLDILMLAMRHPKVIIMVGPWVYNSPFFGWFIRYADYIPAFTNIEESVEKIRDLVADGYSIVVYPEGHRSPDGTIKRFHKGAFYLSETLKLDITPVLLHGIHYTLPKGEFFVKSSYLNLKVLPRISWDDARFGEGFARRTKAISTYFKAEHARFTNERTDADWLAYPLQYAYLYKGPILEWYFKIKYKFEKENYTKIDAILANKKVIYDLGCGNGFLSYFLKLRDENRTVLGVDYDETKIAVAQSSYLKTPGISFETGDVSQLDLQAADAIILMDVLHYLSSEKQLQTLNNCLPTLQNGGILLIKDALANQDEKHQWTKKSERWSTRWVKFNKTENELHFFGFEFIQNWANSYNLSVKIVSESAKSSNTLMEISRDGST